MSDAHTPPNKRNYCIIMHIQINSDNMPSFFIFIHLFCQNIFIKEAIVRLTEHDDVITPLLRWPRAYVLHWAQHLLRPALRRGMFSLCNFGSPYSRGGVASEFFSLKLASFVIVLVSSKLLTD